MFGDALGCPALAALHRAQRARLAHQDDLVVAHREHLRVHRDGRIAGQVHRQRGDLVRRHLLDLLHARDLLRRIGWNRADHATPGKRRDAVGPHAALLEVQCDRLRQCNYPHLGGAVIGLSKIADQTRGGGHVDQAPTALVLHRPCRSTAHEVGPVEVNLDDRVPLLVRHLVKKPVAQYAGVVDHAVDATEVFEGCADDGRSALAVSNAVRVAHGLSAKSGNLLHDTLRRTVVSALARERRADVVDHDTCTLARHVNRYLSPYPASGASDHHDLAGQHRITLHCMLLAFPLWKRTMRPVASVVNASERLIPCNGTDTTSLSCLLPLKSIPKHGTYGLALLTEQAMPRHSRASTSLHAPSYDQRPRYAERTSR